jgi:hypothetical protein
MNRKMIIFEKLNPTLAFAKMVIFSFIFMFHFRHSFKLRYDASFFAVTTTINGDAPSFGTPLPPQQLCHHLPSPLPRTLAHRPTPPTAANQPHWALGNFFCHVFLYFQLTNLFICFF